MYWPGLHRQPALSEDEQNDEINSAKFELRTAALSRWGREPNPDKCISAPFS